MTAMRYPPRGIRGVAKVHRGAAFGADFDDYYLHAHERLLAIMQIETPEAVSNIDAIAAVDGVDVLFVGPTDLTHSMGIRDEFNHPRFLEALRTVADAAMRHGKAAGILVHTAALLPIVRDMGFTFASFGHDGSAVRSGLITILETLRKAE